MVGATLHGAGADHYVAVLDIFLLDNVEDGFEQEGVAIEEDAIDGLDLGGLEYFGRGSGIGLGEGGLREESDKKRGEAVVSFH